MKTIPVSFLVAGMLLPAVCLAQPTAPPAEEMGKQQGPPQQFMEAWKLADADKDGFISKTEFDAMPRIMRLPEEKRANLFKRLDKDADAKLSREELGRLGKKRDGNDQPLKRLWELDSDKSGGISFEEFKAGQLFKKLSAEKQQEVFRRLDTDGDSVITPRDKPTPPFKHQDGKPHFKRGEDDCPDGGDKPGQINRKLDLDGDGSLSFAEFRQGPAVKNLTEDQQEERFELIDRNRDHQLSAEDFPAPSAPKKSEPPPAGGDQNR